MSRDGRKLDHKALEAIRIQAVLRVREDGASPELLIETLGFHRSCIYDWLKRYDEGGLEALKAKPIPGAPLKLAAWQGNWLRQTIVKKTPLDFGYAVALWTRAIVRDVLRCEFGVRASDATVGRWPGVGLERAEAAPAGVCARSGAGSAVARPDLSRDTTASA